VTTDETDEEDSDEEEDEDEERSVTGSLDDSDLEDHMATRKVPVPKSGGSWTDKRRKMFERENGLSSSLEGMSISPGISRLVGQ
jgi:RNA polymerase I-specific transcription initiation factor RRN3